MRGCFLEDMFKQFPYIILCGDMLEVFVVKECGITIAGVGDGLVYCPVHDYVSLTRFVMEYL